jgi:hypothetical protein
MMAGQSPRREANSGGEAVIQAFRTFEAKPVGRALPQNSQSGCGSAGPPDVRRWLCPAVSYKHAIGLGPWFGLRPT